MENLFVNLLELSLSGSIVILLVLVLRLAFKNAPRRLVCLLWLLVGIRLLLPVHIETDFSLQPDLEQLVALPQTQQEFVPEDMVPAVPNPGDNVVISTENVVTVEVQRSINWVTVAAVVWLLGAAAMLVYTLTSYIRLKRQVRGAVQTEDGAWESRSLNGAFLFGYLKPRIFLPAGLTGRDREYVLSHERVHIVCGDHWTKLAGFLCLSMHWFNPMVWIAYRLLCRDLEMACDEQVVRRYSVEERKAYSKALLSCSAGSRPVSVCPIAFGEVDVKERIMKILNYRKPGFWICLVCVIAVIGTAVFFLTDAAPKYNTVFEEYASLIGAHKSELADRAGIKEEDLIYQRYEYYLPEPVIFNGSEFTVSFYAGEDTQDRINGISFQKVGYENIEALAEDLVLIEQSLYKAYGATRYETPIFTDKEQVFADYMGNKSWRTGVTWEFKDTAPYPVTQNYMQEMLSWDSIKQIATRRWGEDAIPRAIFSVDVSAGDYEIGDLAISINYKVNISRKGNWEE